MLEFLTKRIFVVKPQPDEQSISSVTLLVEFQDPADPPHRDVRPVLESIVRFRDTLNHQEQRAALYLTTRSSFESIVDGITGCDPFHYDYRCNVWIGGQPIFLGDRPDIQEGQLLTVRLTPIDESPADYVRTRFNGAASFEQFAIIASARLAVTPLYWTFHLVGIMGEPHRTVALNVPWTHAHSPNLIIQQLRDTGQVAVDEDHFACTLVRRPALDYAHLEFVCGSQPVGQCTVLVGFSQKWDEQWREYHCFNLPCQTTALDIAGTLRLDRFNVWTIFQAGRPVPPGETINLRPGDTLEIELEDTSDEEEASDEEPTSLMQRISPSVSPTLASARLIGFHGRIATIEIDTNSRISEQIASRWPFRHLAEANLYAIHPVSFPPRFATAGPERVYLLEFRDDSFEQIHEDDVMVLVRLVVEAPNAGSNRRQRLKAMWAPKRCTREQLLLFLRLSWYCRRPNVLCFAHLNQVAWPMEDQALRSLESGDHLHVHVRSEQFGWCDMEYSESSDRQRRVFQSSDEEVPSHPTVEPAEGEQADEEGEESELSPYSIRSRSRERHDPEQEHEADSDSLLQISAHQSQQERTGWDLQGHGRSVQLATGHPHVLDRWCDGPERTVPSSDMALPPSHDNDTLKRSTTPFTLADKLLEPTWVRVPCSDLRFLRTQLLQFNLGPIHDRRQVVKWHSSTLAALEGTPDWNGEPAWKFSFFTDGSSMRTTEARIGASAIVLIVHTYGGIRFGGFRVYKVDDKATAPRTEVMAMLIGLLWAHQLGDGLCHDPLPFEVEFGYDCLMAGQVAAGQWAIRAHGELPTHCRALALWWQQRFGRSIAFFHIHSHTGHPWNECADAATWAAVNDWIGSEFPNEILEQLSLQDAAPHLSSWLWMYEAALTGSPQLPRIEDDNFVFNVAAPFQNEPQTDEHPIVVRQKQESPELCRTSSEVTLSVATANVLTLYPGTERPGAFISARHDQLMQQCHDHGLHVIGVQETRSKLSGHMDSTYFHILSSPATAQGVGGVQLWVAKSMQFGHERYNVPYRWLRIVHATTQRMVVSFTAPWMKMLFVVGHAPSNGDSGVASWWQTLPRIIPSTYSSWPTVYLLDANARIGSIQSTAVGAAGATLENEAGGHFHQWMIEHALFAPQTFSAYHTGPHDTWEHGTGTRARIDFVVLDQVLRHPQIRSSVVDTFDISVLRTDHLAVRVDLPVCIADIVPAVRKPQSYDGEQDEPPQVPSIPWQVDVHTHAARLAQAMQPLRTTKVWPRKTHLRETTWWLIQWKQYHWKRCNQLRKSLGRAVLTRLFMAWRSTCDPKEDDPAHGWFHQTRCQLAWHSSQFQKLAPQVATGVKHDDCQYYAELAQRTARVAADEGLPHLWKVLKPLLPKATAKRRSNIRCTGPTLLEMRAHFNKLEAGEQCEYPRLLAQCHAEQAQSRHDAPLVVPLAHIPSIIDMEQLVMKQKRGKAPGLDGVPSQTLKDTVAADPRPFFDLILKTWLTASEPLQYKGGLLHCITKKAGSSNVTAMRGIALLDSFGKIIHALVRSKLLQWSAPRRMPTQFGGFSMQQTLFATQYVRAYANVAAQCHMSSAILFVDVRSAFHCLLREMVFGTTMTFSSRLKATLEEDGFVTDALEALISGRSSAFTSTANPSTVRLLQETHKATWYTLSGHDACYHTWRGSRPGSPLADLAYNTLMTQVLQELVARLQDHPAIQQSAQVMQMFCPPVAWVDDVAIPLAATTPKQLDEVLADATMCVKEVFQTYGLQLNMAPGKTEAVVQYRGKDAPRARKMRFVDAMGHLPLDDSFQGVVLRISSDYQHLGTNFAQSATVHQEIRVRIGKATGVYRQLRRTIFANKKLPVQTRITLLEPLVLSIVFHGAGNWPLLPFRLQKKLHHAVTSWQRTIAGIGHWSQDNISDDALQAKLGIPSIPVRLAKFRLLYGVQWFAQAPPILAQLVSAEDRSSDSWLMAIRHDLEWLSRYEPQLVPTIPTTTEEVFDWFACHSNSRNAVRRAVHKSILEQQIVFEAVDMHKRIHNACVELGVQFAPLDAATPASGLEYPCLTCHRTFASAQALQGHQWRRHGQISDERRYVFSTTCLACNRCYWTAQRLQQHLKQSRRFPNGCYEWMVANFPPLDAPLTISNDHELLRFCRLPACEVEGPQAMPEAPLWQRQQEECLNRIRARWADSGFPSELSATDRQRAAHLLTQVTQLYLQTACFDDDPLELWQSALRNACPPFVEHTDAWALFEWGRTGMYEAIAESDDPDGIIAVEQAFLELAESHPMWQMLCDWEAALNRRAPPPPKMLAVTQPRVNSARHDREHLPRFLVRQTRLLAPWCNRAITQRPRLKGIPIVVDEAGVHTVYFLHLFSGRRRDGDCATHLPAIWEEHFGSQAIRVVLISVDTAVHPTLGNLDRGPNYDRILALARAGVIAASIGGPPCETWSSARHLDLGTSRGPRPLRSSEYPWGIEGRTVRELNQLRMGSRLMLHQLQLDVEIVLRGGASLKEHPGHPREDAHASIWRTALHKVVMMGIAEAHELHVAQWRFGAVSPKPTVLRTIGIPHQGRTFRQLELPDVPYPVQVLGGLSSTGEFKTAQAKEYPSQLCKAIMTAIVKGLRMRHIREGARTVKLHELTQDSQNWLKEMEAVSAVIEEGRTFFPDYQPEL